MSDSPTILVVEDNPLTRKMLRVTLESDGYNVIEAADGRAAQAAMRHSPSLVLQDMILPDINGFELLRQLRERGGPELPILALSGFLGLGEDTPHAETSFNAVLVKPLEPNRLLDIVRPYVPPPARSEPVGQNRRVLVVDDDPLQLKLTRLHLTQLGFSVSTANSTVEALSMARTQPPDVLLSDVLMPDLDGFQFCFEVRKDPALAQLPVVLASAWYEAAPDKELAAHVGANALVLKTPELKGLAETLLAAIDQGAPARGVEPGLQVRLEHSRVIAAQLERLLSAHQQLTRRCTLQAAQIALLSGVADALALHANPDAALRDVLAATLDAAGISKGALFLYGDDRVLRLRHAIGFPPRECSALEDFCGQLGVLEDAVHRQAVWSIPSGSLPENLAKCLLTCMDANSAQIVPLISEGRGVGVMVLCANRTDVSSEDSLAFARAMANQLAQSLDLSSSFARLTASERRYRAVTETAHDAIALCAPGGKIVEVNPSLEAILGLRREQILGRSLEDFVAAGEERDKSAVLGGGAMSGEPPVSLARSDGSLVLMEFASTPIDLNGEKLVVSIGRDVTERVETQAQLMFSDRMASIGALAAGVAHEINNPLTATYANLLLAIEQADELAARLDTQELALLRELLSDAREGAERVRTIMRDLKIFSRTEEDVRVAVDVRRVLESSLRMAWNEIRHRAELVREYADVPAVEASESRLGQVFLNLIVNAAQALPDGYADQHRITVRTRVDAAGRVVAEVEDTGPGIPGQVLPRLFTPFFTTKPRGVGTGLGLSICKRIISSFNGEITVDSVVGRGTRFSVSLPATPAKPVAQPSNARGVEPAARRGRVLVVDDDELSSTVVQRVLAPEHEIIVTADADEALQRLAQGEHFDVIISDLMMPVKTGVEFYAELSQRAPPLLERIIFLTGGAFTVKAREFLDRVSNPCLDKPFDTRRLRALVNERIR